MMRQRNGQQERAFGLGVGTVCLVLAVLWLWRGSSAGWIVGGVAAVLIGLALTVPSLLALPSRLWWKLAHALGWLNARILLSAVFWGLLTPVGLLARIGGWDPLRLKRGFASGWVPYPARDAKHYERMY